MKRTGFLQMSSRARLGPPAVLAILAALLSGCQGAIVGHWRMIEVVPNKEVFCIDDATFRRDGAFTATTTVEGKTTREAGTYRFTGFKLILQPQAGGRRAYSAMLKFGQLEVLNGRHKVVLRKGR